MELLLQFIVLLFTGLVWWLARRDLNAGAAREQAGEGVELERLRVGVEALAADLERRAEAAEARLSARITEARALPPAPAPSVRPRDAECDLPEEDRYGPVYALAAAGVTEPTEIARRTGLTRGEVELLLRLRPRTP